MQMNAYNTYNNPYNNMYNQTPNWGGRPGSRRNSLKNYAAPPPPPPMPGSNMYGRDRQRTPNMNQNYRNSFPPAQNPINELQNMMGRGYDDNQVI